MFAAAIETNGKDSLTLIIKSEKLQISIDSNQYVKIIATIENKGSNKIKLVLPGDGSQSGWRTPILKWSIVDLEDEAKSKYPEFSLNTNPRCGNVNGLIESELVELNSGDKVLFEEWLFASIPKKLGKYRIQLFYENDPSIEWKGMGWHDGGLMRKAKESDPIQIVSNEIIVEIIE